MVFSEEGSIVAGTASKMKFGILLLAQILSDRGAELTKRCRMSPGLQVSSRITRSSNSRTRVPCWTLEWKQICESPLHRRFIEMMLMFMPFGKER
jgi:hypothetical protein